MGQDTGAATPGHEPCQLSAQHQAAAGPDPATGRDTDILRIPRWVFTLNQPTGPGPKKHPRRAHLHRDKTPHSTRTGLAGPLPQPSPTKGLWTDAG